VHSHTAGVPHWREAPGLDPAEPLKLAQTTVGGVPGAAARGCQDGRLAVPFDLDAMPGTGRHVHRDLRRARGSLPSRRQPGHQSLACWVPDRAASVIILVNDEAASITGPRGRTNPLAAGFNRSR